MNLKPEADSIVRKIKQSTRGQYIILVCLTAIVGCSIPPQHVIPANPPFLQADSVIYTSELYRGLPASSDPTDFVAVDEPPKIVKSVFPEIPEDLKSSTKDTTVWIMTLVGKNGKVGKIKVKKGVRSAYLEPAMRAAMQWEFTPAMLKGEPIPVWVAQPFKFKVR